MMRLWVSSGINLARIFTPTPAHDDSCAGSSPKPGPMVRSTLTRKGGDDDENNTVYGDVAYRLHVRKRSFFATDPLNASGQCCSYSGFTHRSCVANVMVRIASGSAFTDVSGAPIISRNAATRSRSLIVVRPGGTACSGGVLFAGVSAAGSGVEAAVDVMAIVMACVTTERNGQQT
jgi:hypothetical protein